jgi:predicted DNA-binding transcriptional regulator AlpA
MKKVEKKPPKIRDLSGLPMGCEPLIGKAEICQLIGVSQRTLQTMLASGAFPAADMKVGIFPRWRQGSYNAWANGRTSAKDSTK